MKTFMILIIVLSYLIIVSNGKIQEEIIRRMRERFQDLVNQTPGAYHPSDVERVRTNTWTVERYLLSTKSEEEAIKALDNTMKWRKEIGINDMNDESFPKEIYELGRDLNQFKDRWGRPIRWGIGRNLKAIPEFKDLLHKHNAYVNEQIDRNCSHEGWALVAELTNLTIENIVLTEYQHIFHVFQDHFPLGYKYILIINAPDILHKGWPIIETFLNDHLRKIIKFVNGEQLYAYIDQDNLPTSLGGNYKGVLGYIPTNAKPLEQFNKQTFRQEL